MDDINPIQTGNIIIKYNHKATKHFKIPIEIHVECDVLNTSNQNVDIYIYGGFTTKLVLASICNIKIWHKSKLYSPHLLFGSKWDHAYITNQVTFIGYVTLLQRKTNDPRLSTDLAKASISIDTVLFIICIRLVMDRYKFLMTMKFWSTAHVPNECFGHISQIFCVRLAHGR